MARSIEEIGQIRLKELGLRVGGDVAAISFNAEQLGWYSFTKQPVLVVLDGQLNRKRWKLMPYSKKTMAEHRGHCYLVKGRHVIRISYGCRKGSIDKILSEYESADLSGEIGGMKTEGLFHAFQGCRGKKTHISGSHKPSPDMRDGVGTVGTQIVTKRFDNSRLTCVCKSRIY